MADLRGRCGNLEYCSAAVSQRIIVLPEGANFACPKCGEALQPLRNLKTRGLSKVGLALQFGIVLAGAGGVAFKLVGGETPDLSAYLPASMHGNVPAPLKVLPQQPPATELAGTAPAPSAGSPQPAPPAQSALTPTLPPAPPSAAPPQQAQWAPLSPPPTLALAESAASPAAAPAPVAAPTTTLFRMAGSNVIGSTLARRLSAGYLALIGDASITSSFGGTEGTLEIAGLQAGQREGVTVMLGSSVSGMNALLRGPRPPSMCMSSMPGALPLTCRMTC